MATKEEAAAKEAADKAAKADQDKADADKKKSEAETKAAEQRLADEQRAQTAEQNKLPVVVVGEAGGAFTIDGPGLGSKGQLTIGGTNIQTTRWDDRSVRGVLPPGVKGDVVLRSGAIERRGIFPPPPNIARGSVVGETNSPTFEEYTKAGYAPETYPPEGHVAVRSPGLTEFRARVRAAIDANK